VDDSHALVVGPSSDIGRAVAAELAELGRLIRPARVPRGVPPALRRLPFRSAVTVR
jgi:NAD(P)-dependent dehydrogenase (short-subunit alcohol dehydrogenase family)